MTRSYTLERPGRPLSANKRLHHMAKAERTREVRGEFKLLTRAAKVPPLAAITVMVRPLAKDRRWLPDVAACYPDVKAAIDGIVDAGVLPKDTAEYVHAVTFLPAEVAGRDALVVTITEVAS